MQIDLNKVNIKNLAFFRFKELNGKYLLTNEVGDFIFLSKEDFKKFIEGRLDKRSRIYFELANKNFIYNRLNKSELIERYRWRNFFLWQGPTLHIIVVTLMCNSNCIYCQSSAKPLSAQKYNMNKSTAKKVVDTIFESPSDAITIEFQGGEPLVNWDCVKFIINYAKKKNKTFKKDLRIALVSNFSLLSQKKLDFLSKHGINLCTSLDGLESLHNKNRPMANPKVNSYRNVVRWIKIIKKKYKNKLSLSALVTISNFSLSYPREIIDEYIKWGFNNIHLRPLSNLGLSKYAKEKIGYTATEFIQFYTTALDYLIDLNLKGKTKMFERTARIFLSKILNDSHSYENYLDLRSPCGAGIGQIAYNYNGKVYTCDEARMLDSDVFLVGDLKRHEYRDLINSPAITACCFSSCLESLFCDYCAYKPYCGVCPVCNYEDSTNIFSQIPLTRRCQINKAILDYLFIKLKASETKKIFEVWVKRGVNYFKIK